MNINSSHISLFPINLSILPFEEINIHIFENRYKQLISNCLEKNKKFGIVYTKNKKMSKIGTTVKINNIHKKYDDGRYDISIRGCERFKIINSFKEKNLWNAEIKILDELYNQIDKKYFNKILDKYLKLILSNKLNNDISNYMNKKVSFDFTRDVALPNSLKQDFLELKNELKRLNFIDIFLDSMLDKNFPNQKINYSEKIFN
tara:strand:- start:15154 stop:15762 length:609 start_codon:yes stop_codon:yes gene_type:complete